MGWIARVNVAYEDDRESHSLHVHVQLFDGSDDMRILGLEQVLAVVDKLAGLE